MRTLLSRTWWEIDGLIGVRGVAHWNHASRFRAWLLLLRARTACPVLETTVASCVCSPTSAAAMALGWAWLRACTAETYRSARGWPQRVQRQQVRHAATSLTRMDPQSRCDGNVPSHQRGGCRSDP